LRSPLQGTRHYRRLHEDYLPSGVVAGGYSRDIDGRGYWATPDRRRVKIYEDYLRALRAHALVDDSQPTELPDIFTDAFGTIARMEAELDRLERRLKVVIDMI
jgi:hypothetical protein